MRKLVYLSTAIIPSTQANSIQIMKMCNALCRFEFDVTLLAGEPYNKNIDVFEYYGLENDFSIVTRKSGYHKGSTFFLSIRYYPLLKTLAKSDDDILFYGRDVISLYILAQAGRQVIYEVHDIFRRGPRKWAEERLIKSRNLHKIVFISNELKKVYLEKYDKLLMDNQLIIAPDAADEQPDFTETIKLNGGFSFNACYIGGLYKGRGIELILRMAEKTAWAGFHIFGGSRNQIDSFKRNSSSNVYFYEYIPPSQTYKIRNAADVLLMPYQKEVKVAQNSSDTSRWMSPMKLFEYMSSRKPIISSNHKALQEVLEHERNCLLCEPDITEQWVDAVERIKKDRKLSSSISKTAYVDFIGNYTWDKRIKRILFESHVTSN